MLTIQVGIAVITLDNPPVNALGHALPERIVLQIEAAQADPLVRGIVLTGSARAFSAGADVGFVAVRGRWRTNGSISRIAYAASE